MCRKIDPGSAAQLSNAHRADLQSAAGPVEESHQLFQFVVGLSARDNFENIRSQQRSLKSPRVKAVRDRWPVEIVYGDYQFDFLFSDPCEDELKFGR